MTRCDHSESLYGRCVSCGMTWAEQAHARGEQCGLRSCERCMRVAEYYTDVEGVS